MNISTIIEEKYRQEIIDNPSNNNMFIEAGAGAGKTTLIINRIVNILQHGINGSDVKPKEIAIITFTNKAAEELRVRISEKINKIGSLEDVRQELDQMNISTIHSFCNVLLREQGLSIGLPVDLHVLDEEEAKEIQSSFLNKYICEMSDNDWSNIERYTSKTRYSIKKDMESLYFQIVNLPMDTEFVIDEPVDKYDKYDYKEISEKLRKVIYGDPSQKKQPLEQLIRKSIYNCINQKNNKDGFDPMNTSIPLSKVIDYEYSKPRSKANVSETLISNNLNNLINYLTNPKENEGQIMKWLAKFDNNSSYLKKTDDKLFIKTNIKKQNEYLIKKLKIRDIRKMPTELKDALISESDFNDEKHKPSYFNHLWLHVKKARDKYREELPRQYVTNDLLLEYTRDLMRNNDSDYAYRFFTDKYKCIFVDEFQDTDRIQEEFIYQLATDPDNLDNLRDGVLFIVGDPKQSIYRFRGAQPEVFSKTRDNIKKLSNGITYKLNINHRSSEKVLEWINNSFTALDTPTPERRQSENFLEYNLTEGSFYKKMDLNPQWKNVTPNNISLIDGVYHVDHADALWDYAPLCKNGNYEVKLKTKTKIYPHAYTYSCCDQDDDINTVLEIILKLTEKDSNGNSLFHISDDKFEPKGIEYEDFLLISSRKKHMEEYVRALEAYGIPVTLDGEESLNDNRILMVYIRLFTYLVNPKDAFAKVGAQEAIRLTLNTDDEKTVTDISNNILNCLYYDSKTMTPYGKALFLEKQLSALLDKNISISAITASKSQMLIRQMIEKLCTEDGIDGITLAQKMIEYSITKLEHELPASPKSNGVRFMNLHKTKGLEGNIIILLDRMPENNKFYHYQHDNLYYPGINGWTPIKDNEKLYKQAANEEMQEFHRLEYVAVTRAKRAVIFMGIVKSMSGEKRRGLFASQKGLHKINDAGGHFTGYYKELDKTTFGYDLSDTPDIMKTIEDTLAIHNKTNANVNKPTEPPKKYNCNLDNYTNILEKNNESQPVLFFKSPSKEEASVDKKATNTKEDETLKRPSGNIVGNILHRTMELLVSKCFINKDADWIKNSNSTRLEKKMNTCVLQAIEDESDNIKSTEGKKPWETSSIKSFILLCEKSFMQFLCDKWDNIDSIYPEVCFSYMEDNNTWMNGTADLILKLKTGKFLLIDYKSDSDINVTESDMIEYLTNKYKPQLSIYRDVIANQFKANHSDIETALVSFSQKDADGNILKDNSLRLRYTDI